MGRGPQGPRPGHGPRGPGLPGPLRGGHVLPGPEDPGRGREPPPPPLGREGLRPARGGGRGPARARPGLVHPGVGHAPGAIGRPGLPPDPRAVLYQCSVYAGPGRAAPAGQGPGAGASFGSGRGRLRLQRRTPDPVSGPPGAGRRRGSPARHPGAPGPGQGLGALPARAAHGAQGPARGVRAPIFLGRRRPPGAGLRPRGQGRGGRSGRRALSHHVRRVLRPGRARPPGPGDRPGLHARLPLLPGRHDLPSGPGAKPRGAGPPGRRGAVRHGLRGVVLFVPVHG